MIDRDQMFVLMLDAHPGFSELWNEFADKWSKELKGLPYHLLMSDVVRECSKMLAGGQKHHISKILEVVERWLLEGDPYVRNVAIIGFIEGIQNSSVHDGTEPKDFIQFLGPESSFWWRKVDRFWSHGELIIDDR